MTFNSIEYLIFLPVVFALYWSLRKWTALQNTLIVGASYVFYGWWDVRFLALIVFSTLCSYMSGLLIHRSGNKKGRRSFFNILNIVMNLGILGVFKYYDFFTDNLVSALRPIGINCHPASLHLILPVGISFYTFQALSYTIDVYRRRIPPARDIMAFCAYICFFPQLVAGPIESASHLLPQFRRKRTFRYPEAVDGMRLILIGLFKKMVIADNCAQSVDTIFGGWENFGSGTLIIGALLFTLQIYGDFSGYSDIAIGSAKLFGISLTDNFHAPYFARSIADFWRRWHISLQTWFRDHVYIPLGGGKCGETRKQLNTFIVFLLSGLWHGAAWTFVCWGLYHALLFIPFRFLKRFNINSWLMRAVTFVCVVIGWVIFRSGTLQDAMGYIVRMFSFQSFLSVPPSATLAAVAISAGGILLAAEYRTTDGQIAQLLHNAPKPVRWSAYIVLALSIIALGGENDSFIYFQF